MRVPLPSFILRRLPRARRPARRDDPADMGTEFGLDASIAGWENSLPAQGRTARIAADEAPMHWLGRPAGRKTGE